jgi:L-alanine-DL-glutamate epimerase-like enolase superfamily enzyme
MNRVEQLVEEHGPALAEDVRATLANDADRKVVGVISEDDAPEAPAFAAAIAQMGGRGKFAGGAWCVVTRTSAVDMLKAIAPPALEWLEDSTSAQLPIVVVLKDGTQLATIPL